MYRLFAAVALVAMPGLAFAQGATQLGEGHARSAMTAYGCSNLSAIGSGPMGTWHAQCSKGGQTVNVVMDSKGVVTSGTMPAHMTSGNARSAMTAAGCSNISNLSEGPNNSWHGQCSKGGATVNAMMDSKGAVTMGGTPTHVTESQARSILTNAGCSNISVLSPTLEGSWVGQCGKGGRTVNAAVDAKGTVTTQ